VTLRDGPRVVTDVDAVIFDRTCGDLAMFQLKWQDYFTNNIRELRSRAKNLTQELDAWGDRVLTWLEGRSWDEIFSALRLSPKCTGGIRFVTLFAISRSMARVGGLGYMPRNEHVALANWAQLLRLRREIGPVDSVFPRLHSAIRSEAEQKALCTPIPVEWKIGDITVRFANNWNAVADPEDDADENGPRYGE